jgi:hypothetical protein
LLLDKVQLYLKWLAEVVEVWSILFVEEEDQFYLDKQEEEVLLCLE